MWNIRIYHWAFYFSFLIVILLQFTPPLEARDLKVSMAYMPSISETKAAGVFANYIKSIDSYYDEGAMTVEIFPFARSMNNLLHGDYDMHIPLIINPLSDTTTLPYRYMSHKGWDIPFIIYSHKDKMITREQIDVAKSQKPFPLTIATDRAHVDFFDFPTLPVSHIEGGLKQVATKRVDAYIFALPPSDYVLKTFPTTFRSKLCTSLYENFEATIVLKKGKKGSDIDAILNTSLKMMEKNGELAKFYQTIWELNMVDGDSTSL